MSMYVLNAEQDCMHLE